MSALAHKAKVNAIVIVEDIKLDAPKTSQFRDALKGLSLAGKKILYVIPEYDDNVYLSLRNIPTVEGALLADINTYDIVNAEVLVLSETAAKVFADETAEEVKA
jgi:large subunit ribosomal protein L4